MRKVIVSPSILNAPIEKIAEVCANLDKAGASYIHFDVMDGIFVPNKTYSIEDFNHIKNVHHLVNDVHLMVATPYDYTLSYLENGADIVTIHYEAASEDEIRKIIDLIHSFGKKAGLSIKPMTDVKVLLPFIDSLDLILIMSVEPGKGGQSFMPNSLDKIAFLRNYIDEHKLSTLIEVDGGINNLTAPLVREVGVDVLVSGTYIINGDYKERIDSLLK